MWNKMWLLSGFLFLLGPIAVFSITIPSLEGDINHENTISNISASERNRRLIPYMSYYIPQNSYPISQHYLIEQNAPSLSPESPSATIANNKQRVINLPVAYIQMKVPQQYEHSTTILPYRDHQRYESSIATPYKIGKKKVTSPFTASNIVPGNFVPIVYASTSTTAQEDNGISDSGNSGKLTNIETTYNGNTGQIQHPIKANHGISSTTEVPKSTPYYSNGPFVYVSNQNDDVTTTNKITSQEKYVLYLREQLRHKQIEELKDHEQKQQNLQQMQKQMYFTQSTSPSSSPPSTTPPTLHYHSPAPSKEYLKLSKPIILQNIQEKQQPQNHYYHEQRRPQSQHLNGHQREKEVHHQQQQHHQQVYQLQEDGNDNGGDDDSRKQQQYYYYHHQNHDEIYQKQNTSPPQVHNHHHHYQVQQQQQQTQQHHPHQYYQVQHHQQQQDYQHNQDYNNGNQPLQQQQQYYHIQHQNHYHQSPNKAANLPENSIETQSKKPPVQILIAEVKPTSPSKPQSYESYILIPSPVPPYENEATPSTEPTPVYTKPLVLQQLAPIQRPHRPKAKPFRFNKYNNNSPNRLSPSLQSPITNYYQNVPYKSPPVHPKNNKIIKLRPVPNFESNTVQQEQEAEPENPAPILQPTVPSIRYKQNQQENSEDEKTASLKQILKKLQESNHLPKTFTADNIDNSIKTLIKILNNLKETQTIMEYPSQHHEEDYDYNKHHHHHEYQHHKHHQHSQSQEEHNNANTNSYKDVDETEFNSNPNPNNGRPGIDYPILYEIPKTEFNCKEQRYKGFFGDTETNCQVWHYCDLNGGQASFLCPNGTIFSQVALTCDWWFNVKCANTPQQYVLNERLYKYILPFTPKFPEDYNGPLVDKYLALKFKEMEEKMQKEKQKGREKDMNEIEMMSKDKDVDNDDNNEDIENPGSIDTFYKNEIEKTTSASNDGSTKITTFSNNPIVVPGPTETPESTVTTTSRPFEESETETEIESKEKKKSVTEISVEKVNVIEIRPDGSSGHIIPSIYQASQR